MTIHIPKLPNSVRKHVNEVASSIIPKVKKHWRELLVGVIVSFNASTDVEKVTVTKKYEQPGLFVTKPFDAKVFQEVKKRMHSAMREHMKKNEHERSVSQYFVYNYSDIQTPKIHPAMQEYLKGARLDDVMKDHILPKDSELLIYGFDLQKAWDKKTRLAKNTSESNRLSIEQAKKNALSYPKKQYSLQMIFDTFVSVGIDIQKELKKREAWTITPFDDYVDGKVLFSLFIHEIMPPEYHPETKIHIMRMLLDRGFQPNLYPAIHDHVSSFNLMQMCKETDEGIKANYPKLTKYYKIPPFEQNMDLTQQIRVGTLLLYDNMSGIKKEMMNSPALMTLWKKASDQDRYEFITTISAGFHNGPGITLRAFHRAMKQVGVMKSLDEMRQTCVEQMGKRNTVNPHALDSTHITSSIQDALRVQEKKEQVG